MKLEDIYSPENIARSRARAANFRELVECGKLSAEWLDVAAEVEAYATEREAEAGRLATRTPTSPHERISS